MRVILALIALLLILLMYEQWTYHQEQVILQEQYGCEEQYNDPYCMKEETGYNVQ